MCPKKGLDTERPSSAWTFPFWMSWRILTHLGKWPRTMGRMLRMFPSLQSLPAVLAITCPRVPSHRPGLESGDHHIECAYSFLPWRELCYEDMSSFTLRLSRKKRKIFLFLFYMQENRTKINQEISRLPHSATFCAYCPFVPGTSFPNLVFLESS